MRNVFWLSLTLLGMMGITVAARLQAGECRVVGQSVVVQPTVPGVIVPAHTVTTVVTPTAYQDTYHSSYVDTHVKELLVPIFQPLPFFIDPRISYLHNGGNYVGVPLTPAAGVASGHTAPVAAAAATAPAQPAAASDTELDHLIDRIEKRVKERQPGLAAEPDGPPPVPGFKKLAVASVSARTSLQVLRQCASCHTGSKSKGDFTIFSTPGRLAPSLDHTAILDAITPENGGSPRMPPGTRPKIKEADVELLRREWRLVG